jgi:hypothetical protein
MAFGIGEAPERSVGEILRSVEYPVGREELVEAVVDAPAEVINFLKCLPRERYDSLEMALRDLAEAARRFGSGGHAPLVGTMDRRNIGRDVIEDNVDGLTRHP